MAAYQLLSRSCARFCCGECCGWCSALLAGHKLQASPTRKAQAGEFRAKAARHGRSQGQRCALAARRAHARGRSRRSAGVDRATARENSRFAARFRAIRAGVACRQRGWPSRLRARASIQGEGDPRSVVRVAERARSSCKRRAHRPARACFRVRASGERVLDACAGRGQKTSLFAEQVGPGGAVWATDVYPKKLAALQADSERLGACRSQQLRAVDWTVGAGDVPADFDRVLVDAPCTGTGTLRRRPEIAARLQATDPGRLSALAETILRSAATRARPAGRVVFAVCSVLEEECEALVERVLDVLEPAPFDCPELPGVVPEGATSFRIGPTQFATDGYFAANFSRR